MARREDIEAAWLLRPLRLLRVDPARARIWATLLAVLIGVAGTVGVAWFALLKLEWKLAGYPDAYRENLSVAVQRGLVLLAGGIVSLTLVGVALWRWRWAPLWRDASARPGHPRLQMWLLLAAAGVVFLAAVLVCLFCLPYRPMGLRLVR
jgi:uncharacterized membrane protein YidH (DUF202 family)